MAKNHNDLNFCGKYIDCFPKTGELQFLVENSDYVDRQKMVCVKVMLEVGNIISEIKDFLNQIISGSLSPYLLKYYCFFERHDKLHIVMEYCGNESLESFLVKRKKSKILFDGNKLKKMIAQLTVGLFELHCGEIKTLHNDIKTENILLSGDDLKIAGFGTSKFVRTIDGWKAPELKGRNPTFSEKSDIYSMGLVFEQIVSVCGLIKFENDSSIPSDLRRVIWSMLSKNPNDRPYVHHQSSGILTQPCDLIGEPYIKEAILGLPHDSLPKAIRKKHNI